MKNLTNKKEIKIATHYGLFHADEIFAIALVKVFVNNNIVVYRVTHQAKEFNNYDLIIDISRKYDGVKYFDHHQNKPEKDGKSSAGLIFEKLKEEGLLLDGVIKELEEVIKVIDMQDLGIEDAPRGHIADIIQYYNKDNVYSEEQNKAFLFAVEVVSKYLNGVKRKYENIEKAKEMLKQCKIVDKGRVLISDQFIPFWNIAIFKLPELNNIDAFVWFDKNQKCWKIQQVPDAPGGFGRRGRKVQYKEPLPKGVEFIHRGEFFAVGDSPKVLLDLLVEP